MKFRAFQICAGSARYWFRAVAFLNSTRDDIFLRPHNRRWNAARSSSVGKFQPYFGAPHTLLSLGKFCRQKANCRAAQFSLSP
jgi:hypothetical protein